MKTAGRRFGLQKNRFVSFVKSLLGMEKKPLRFYRFRDPLGDFEISYPGGWRYDKDIAVVDGKYTIVFESSDACFTISVDTAIPEKFNFKSYAKAELESPSAGIYAPMKRGRFRKMPAYRRKYSFTSGGKDYFGGGAMFFTGKSVFSISWNGPESRRKELQEIFDYMLKTIAIGEGFLVRMRRR